MRKGTLMVVLFLGWLFGPPSNVQKAGEAYQAKRYKEAVGLYAGEMENYLGQQIRLNFNQAQCWMRLDSNAKALNLFSNCTQAYAESRQVASWSWNQIGTLLAMGKAPKAPQQPGGAQPGAANPAPGMQPGMNPMMGMDPNAAQQTAAVSREDLELALNSFKEALKLDHDNEPARYNYELIKRKLQQQDQNQNQNQENQQQQQQQNQQQQQQQNQQNKPKPQPQENQGNQQQQQQQGEGKDPMEMSMEEAERILSAMNSNEKKFLQQLERGKKHKTYNDDGPNW